MRKKQGQVRIQLFPTNENGVGSGRVGSHSTVSGLYFKPIELDIKIGSIIRLGRRAEKSRSKRDTQFPTDDERNESLANLDMSVSVERPTGNQSDPESGLVGNELKSLQGKVDYNSYFHRNSNAIVIKEEAEYDADDPIINGIRNQIKVGLKPQGPLGKVAKNTLSYHTTETNNDEPQTKYKPGGNGESSESVEKFKIPIIFVSFRSKVVSRKHAEMWVGLNSRVYFRDSGSSSGTFLNRAKLSPSDGKSRTYVVNSGDVIQLGIDYQSSQKEVFKSILLKIIINTNATVRSKENNERLSLAIKQLTAAINPFDQQSSGDYSEISSDCCICLGKIVLMQALFFASCSHIFHYKCVVPLLNGGVMFLCPLCRQATNLDSKSFDKSSYLSSEESEETDESDKHGKELESENDTSHVNEVSHVEANDSIPSFKVEAQSSILDQSSSKMKASSLKEVERRKSQSVAREITGNSNPNDYVVQEVEKEEQRDPRYMCPHVPRYGMLPMFTNPYPHFLWNPEYACPCRSGINAQEPDVNNSNEAWVPQTPQYLDPSHDNYRLMANRLDMIPGDIPDGPSEQGTGTKSREDIPVGIHLETAASSSKLKHKIKSASKSPSDLRKESFNRYYPTMKSDNPYDYMRAQYGWNGAFRPPMHHIPLLCGFQPIPPTHPYHIPMPPYHQVNPQYYMPVVDNERCYMGYPESCDSYEQRRNSLYQQPKGGFTHTPYLTENQHHHSEKVHKPIGIDGVGSVKSNPESDILSTLPHAKSKEESSEKDLDA